MMYNETLRTELGLDILLILYTKANGQWMPSKLLYKVLMRILMVMVKNQMVIHTDL